jgi:hypothetical protein
MGKESWQNNATITIRLSIAERQKIEDYAKAQGISLSDALRGIIADIDVSKVKINRVQYDKLVMIASSRGQSPETLVEVAIRRFIGI